MDEQLNVIGFILGVYAFILTIAIGLLKKEYHKAAYTIFGMISIITIVVYLFIGLPITVIYVKYAHISANIFLFISIILLIIIIRKSIKLKSVSSSQKPSITEDEAKIIGIKNFYIESKRTIDETIKEARTRYQLLAVSAEYVQTGEFRTIIENKKSCKFQILLLNPSMNNEGTYLHAKREARTDLTHKIMSGTMGIYSLRKNQDIDIECRFYNELPIFRLVILNNEKCYLGYYGCLNHKGIAYQGIDLPQIELKKTEKGLFIPFSDYWERLWNNGIIPETILPELI